MATFVLVHGGGHGAWCWEALVPLLRQAGHRTVAPDLPSLGSDPTPPQEVTSEKCVQQVATTVETAADAVVLVGHSLGGCVISEVAELMPERIAGLVYVTAALVAPGHSIQAMVRERLPWPQGFRLSDDGICTIVDPACAVDIFYNRTPPDIAARATARLRPNPNVLGSGPTSTTPQRWGRVRRAFVECTDDHIFPLAFQRQMQDALPCNPVITLEADHSPFYSAPQALAAALNDLAAPWTA